MSPDLGDPGGKGHRGGAGQEWAGLSRVTTVSGPGGLIPGGGVATWGQGGRNVPGRKAAFCPLERHSGKRENGGGPGLQRGEGTPRRGPVGGGKGFRREAPRNQGKAQERRQESRVPAPAGDK